MTVYNKPHLSDPQWPLCSSQQPLSTKIGTSVALLQGTLNSSRVQEILRYLTPLTLPYRDLDNRRIQLWHSAHYGLLGVVWDEVGELKIIPASHIFNSLNPSEKISLWPYRHS